MHSPPFHRQVAVLGACDADHYKLTGNDTARRREQYATVDIGRVGIGPAEAAAGLRLLALAKHLHDRPDAGCVVLIHDARLQLGDDLGAALRDLLVRMLHFGGRRSVLGGEHERTDALELVLTEPGTELFELGLALAGQAVMRLVRMTASGRRLRSFWSISSSSARVPRRFMRRRIASFTCWIGMSM